jgi:hypothetical protein
VKSISGTTNKISIELLESLLKPILDNEGLTEEQLCIQLKYNDGYISQLRSREKKTGKPQISPKFYEKLLSYSLRNAKNVNHDIADDPVDYKNEGAFSKGKDAFNALLAKKDRAIKKAEERALKAEKLAKKIESQYNVAIKEKLKLLDITNSLKEMSKNLNDVVANLNQINQHLAQLKDRPLPFVKKGIASANRQQDGKKKGKG